MLKKLFLLLIQVLLHHDVHSHSDSHFDFVEEQVKLETKVSKTFNLGLINFDYLATFSTS
jgi:hypothetical protein